MPKKREASGLLEDQIAYTKELLELVKEDERFTTVPAIKEQVDYLEEIINDTENEIEYSKDNEAKVGHKTADTSFFGYKTHIAMTPERIIMECSDRYRHRMYRTISHRQSIPSDFLLGEG